MRACGHDRVAGSTPVVIERRAGRRARARTKRDGNGRVFLSHGSRTRRARGDGRRTRGERGVASRREPFIRRSRARGAARAGARDDAGARTTTKVRRHRAGSRWRRETRRKRRRRTRWDSPSRRRRDAGRAAEAVDASGREMMTTGNDDSDLGGRARRRWRRRAIATRALRRAKRGARDAGGRRSARGGARGGTRRGRREGEDGSRAVP